MDPVQALLEDNFSDEVSIEIVEHIYGEFLLALEEQEKEAKAIPFVAALAMNKLHEMVKLANYKYDGDVEPNQPFEKMNSEAEPFPSMIDSWARGTVTTRKVVSDPNDFRRKIPTTQSSTPSVSSYRSSVTGRSRNTSANRTYRSTTSKSAVDDKTGKIIELDIDGEMGALNLNATGFMFDMLQKAKKKKGQSYSAIKEGVKGEFETMEEQLAKAAKDMKGKKFILDRYGIPIAIGRVDPQHLPALATPLGVAIKAHETQSAEHTDGHHSHKKDDKKKKQFVRVAGSRTVDQSSFEPTLSLATTLSGVETIPRLNPGVTLRSKASERSGEVIEEDPKHMSINSYMARSLATKSSSTVGGDSVFSGGRVGEGGLSPARSAVFSSNGSLGSNAHTRSMDSIPDVNPLEGSRRVVFADELRDPTDHELGLGPADSAGSPLKSQLPTKPSRQQKTVINKLRNSPDKGKPRDRDFPVNATAVSDRKHLPAPPLGQTTGHGLYNEKSQMSSSMDDSSWLSKPRK